METLVGQAVRKAFLGYGTFVGMVESYEPDTGYLRVLYEDGDSKEVDANEITKILVGPVMPHALQQLQHTSPRDAPGWRPKKRHRRRDGDGDEDNVSPTLSPDGVVLAVPTAGSEESEPASPAEKPEAVVEKKRRVSPAPEPESSRPLRRSTRQAKAAERVAEMEAAAVADVEEDAAAAAAVAVSTSQQSGRKQPYVSGSARYHSVSRDLEEAAAVEELPQKPELPPSSQGLELRSTYVNPLIDWVHFALLQALKSHLEDFTNEGDPSAVHCIRSLNWELLDLATWPIYLAEYLLTRGTELR